jgi:hypothetical protein
MKTFVSPSFASLRFEAKTMFLASGVKNGAKLAAFRLVYARGLFLP